MRITKADLRRLVWFLPGTGYSYTHFYGFCDRWLAGGLIESVDHSTLSYRLTSLGKVVRATAVGYGVRSGSGAKVSDEALAKCKETFIRNKEA